MTQLPNPSAAPVRSDLADSSLDATGAALARLAWTRQRLLLTIAPHKSASAQSDALATRFPRRWHELGRMLMSNGPSAALLRAVTVALGQWWHAQPWAAASGMLGHAVAQEVRPVVRRHPWVAMITMLALGAAVVAARPLLWRVSKPHVASMGVLLLRGAWNLFTRVPVQMAITAALAVWMGEQQRDATPHGERPPDAAGAPSDS